MIQTNHNPLSVVFLVQGLDFYLVQDPFNLRLSCVVFAIRKYILFSQRGDAYILHVKVFSY